jgi:hypothetical protein
MQNDSRIVQQQRKFKSLRNINLPASQMHPSKTPCAMEKNRGKPKDVERNRAVEQHRYRPGRKPLWACPMLPFTPPTPTFPPPPNNDNNNHGNNICASPPASCFADVDVEYHATSFMHARTTRLGYLTRWVNKTRTDKKTNDNGDHQRGREAITGQCSSWRKQTGPASSPWSG